MIVDITHDLYAMKKGKHYLTGGYDSQTKTAHVIHVDGPYHWSLIFYRPYLNRITVFTRPFEAADDAVGPLHAVFDHIAVDGVSLDSFLRNEWKRQRFDNEPDQVLAEARAEIESLPVFKDITPNP